MIALVMLRFSVSDISNAFKKVLGWSFTVPVKGCAAEVLKAKNMLMMLGGLKENLIETGLAVPPVKFTFRRLEQAAQLSASSAGGI